MDSESAWNSAVLVVAFDFAVHEELDVAVEVVDAPVDGVESCIHLAAQAANLGADAADFGADDPGEHGGDQCHRAEENGSHESDHGPHLWLGHADHASHYCQTVWLKASANLREHAAAEGALVESQRRDITG